MPRLPPPLYVRERSDWAYYGSSQLQYWHAQRQARGGTYGVLLPVFCQPEPLGFASASGTGSVLEFVGEALPPPFVATVAPTKGGAA